MLHPRSVSKTVGPSSAKDKKGIDQAMSAIQEPKKISTMEKSSIDWDGFKQKEGIEDELKQYTKDGYGVVVSNVLRWFGDDLMPV